MLKIPTEFPQAGSEAVLVDSYRRERRVRIVTRLDGNRAFVTGKDRHGAINMTVDMDSLRPFAEPKAAVDLWVDGRVTSVLHPSFTRAADAWADFKSWYARIYQRPVTIDHAVFRRSLQERGFVRQRRQNDLGWAFALAPERAVA